jgi:rfaE bifunctional protein kinase chain/domain
MIVVAGDSMLDRYWEGRVDRISPEAPVPILSVSRETVRAGGAANVAVNIASLGNPVTLVSPIGADQAGNELRAILHQSAVTVRSVDTGKTLEKIRFVASRQQLLRADFEHQNPPIDSIGDADIVVLSDYAKGALKNAQALISSVKCRVLVDPKGDLAKYQGAFLVKPNETETRQHTGEWESSADFFEKCRALRKHHGFAYLLVTRGDQGMTLFEEGEATNFPAEVRDVYDVSGAGDTVIAILAHALKKGMDIKTACHLANRAAGIVVSKFGTASVSANEL